MSRPLRTFVAVKCSSPVVRLLRRQADRLALLDEAFRPPATDDLHLTVQFLGNTAEEDVPGIARALEEAVGELGAFDVRYRGLGAFPEPARARVVWAGVEEVEAPGSLAALSRRVGEALEAVGYPPERRAWHPHVTLGRLRSRPSPALVEAVAAGTGVDLGEERVSELKLILSDPGNRGYRYIDLTTVELA
jgi:2'-5' RNA ligase